MKAIRVGSHGWPGILAGVPESFRERLAGLRSHLAGNALLIETRSVHTIGMDAPIGVAVLDKEMTVIQAKIVAPNRVLFDPKARYYLEVAAGFPLPIPGSVIEVADG
jgi:hypothetical protein